MTADGGEKDFLRRWSRLKTEERDRRARTSETSGAESQQPVGQTEQTCKPSELLHLEAPIVPPVESLNIDSDYRPFFHPKIEEGLRRAALKKLFSDPHFNVMDGLDVYIDDYSKADPLPEGMLEQLEQAKKIFAWSREDAEERAKADARKDDAASVAAPTSRVPSTLPEDMQTADAQPSAATDVNSPPRAE